MNETELKIYNKYKTLGYDIIHIGVPDFILLKNGEIKFLEVKGPKDRLRSTQEKAISLLKEHGFEVVIETPGKGRPAKLRRSRNARLGLQEMLDGSTRIDIMMTLINNAKEMTLTEISKEMGLAHQLVDYHLPILLDMGLIIEIGEERKYFCQPAFIDNDIQQKIAEIISDIVPDFVDLIFLEDFETQEDKIKVLKNCLILQLMITMNQLVDLLFDKST